MLKLLSMKAPAPNLPTTPEPKNGPPTASDSCAKATAASNLQAVILQFCIQYDVPAPLEYFDDLISRSGAFLARGEGRLILEEVRSRAAVRPSELARHLRNKQQLAQAESKAA